MSFPNVIVSNGGFETEVPPIGSEPSSPPADEWATILDFKVINNMVVAVVQTGEGKIKVSRLENLTYSALTEPPTNE